MSKYVIYPTVVDFEDMAVHNWSQYATYYHLFSQVKHQSGQRREAEIIKTGQYVTPEFTFSNTEFFVPFIAETPLDSLFELILFIKENPPSDSDLYQFLPQIEKKTGGQEGFLDLILQNLFTHPETDPKGEKRLSQEMFGKFIEESQEWGIIPEAPYSYLRKYLFDRLHNKATDLEQAFDNTSGEVYLYVKK